MLKTLLKMYFLLTSNYFFSYTYIQRILQNINSSINTGVAFAFRESFLSEYKSLARALANYVGSDISTRQLRLRTHESINYIDDLAAHALDHRPATALFTKINDSVSDVELLTYVVVDTGAVDSSYRGVARKIVKSKKLRPLKDFENFLAKRVF